jgi:hypothetical protein
MKGERLLGFKFGNHYDPVYRQAVEDLPRIDPAPLKGTVFTRSFLWLSKYPWRAGVSPLVWIDLDSVMTPNTPLWHAFFILQNYADFTASFKGVRSENQKPNVRTEVVLCVAKACFNIGKSFDAIKKKPLEYDAVNYAEDRRARTNASGAKSASSREKRIEAFMSEIEKLGDIFPRANEAAVVDQAFQNAVQKNRKLWRQGAGQKEEYLSHDLSSTDPYKTRYYAIFGKTA